MSQDSLEGLRALMVELDRNPDSQLAGAKKALAEIRRPKPKEALLARALQTLRPCIIPPFVSPHLLNPGFRVHAHYLSTTHAQIMPTHYQIPTVASSFRFL
ncbi:MAG: hypothetical protein JRN17_01595 [Nitrososphaerota archaeon]|nr:hypothetical protein [Nitrososphaerota archaeon]